MNLYGITMEEKGWSCVEYYMTPVGASYKKLPSEAARV